MPGLYSSYIAKYNSPGRDFDINIVRAVVCVFFIWKLMSRDFGFYGTVPENVFSFYPIYIYRPHDYIYLLGLPILNDIATMHWIHWILPRMDPFGLRVVQGLAITFVIMLMIFGRGPRRIFAVGDVRAGSVKRVASGVGEGSVVVSRIWSHVDQLRRAEAIGAAA